MANTQKRLGRGLSSIISMTEEPVPSPVKEVEEASGGPSPRPFMIGVDHLRPNPFQPRKDVDPKDLQALANSIRKVGVVQPIIVRCLKDDLYEIIAGERRWRAAQMAGLTEVPAVTREATDEQMLEVALVENIFRSDLNAIERAMAYKRYSDEFNLSADEIAGRLGEDRSTVANYLRLLELPADVKHWVAERKLAMGHARCLLAIRSPSDLVRTAKEAISKDLSVRALEALVRRRVTSRSEASSEPGPGKATKRPQIRSLEQEFVRALGTKVEISESRKRGNGKIVIHYFNLDDFDRIAERLGVVDK